MDGVNVLIGELVTVEAVQPMQMRLSCARRLVRLSDISTQVTKRPPSYLQVCGRATSLPGWHGSQSVTTQIAVSPWSCTLVPRPT